MAQNVVLDALLLKRGTEQNRSQLVPKLGEPIYATDSKDLYIGDGVTPGGNPVGALKVTGAVTGGGLAVFEGTTGKILKSVPKATLMSDYVTNIALEARLKTQLQVQVDSSKQADNASKLNGRSDYITADTKTNSFLENDAGKVSSAQAPYLLYQEVLSQLRTRDTAIGTKVDKSSVVNSVSSTSTTDPCSANAVKQTYDLASGAQQVATSAQTLAQSALSTATSAGQAAQLARSAPDLAPERKRPITVSANPASGTPDEGTIWIQV